MQITQSVRKFLPLISVFAVILVLTSIRQVVSGLDANAAMFDFMASFFFTFGSLKIVNLPAFARKYAQYDEAAKIIPNWGYAYPFIELALGIAFLTHAFVSLAAIITIALMTEKAAGIYINLTSGPKVQCACLGGFFTIPVTWVTFGEDMLMVVMAIVMLAYGN